MSGVVWKVTSSTLVAPMRRAALFFTTCSLVFAGAAPVHAAGAVSITTTPAVPVAAQAVTLTASGGSTYDWDLDGDGTFGDAAGAVVSRTFAAGSHTVSARATDGSGRTSAE